MTSKFILGATTLAIGSLVMTMQPRPDRFDTPAPRFDELATKVFSST